MRYALPLREGCAGAATAKAFLNFRAKAKQPWPERKRSPQQPDPACAMLCLADDVMVKAQRGHVLFIKLRQYGRFCSGEQRSGVQSHLGGSKQSAGPDLAADYG